MCFHIVLKNFRKICSKWALFPSKANFERSLINNKFYDDLGEEWNDRFDHPIALLRAENAIRTPWVAICAAVRAIVRFATPR